MKSYWFHLFLLLTMVQYNTSRKMQCQFSPGTKSGSSILDRTTKINVDPRVAFPREQIEDWCRLYLDASEMQRDCIIYSQRLLA